MLVWILTAGRRPPQSETRGLLHMNKADLTAAVVSRCRGTDFESKAAAERAVDAVFRTMTETLASGEKVVISGFGSFEVVTRAERQGRNVQTKEPITIPAHKAVRFNAGKGLREGVRKI